MKGNLARHYATQRLLRNKIASASFNIFLQNLIIPHVLKNMQASVFLRTTCNPATLMCLVSTFYGKEALTPSLMRPCPYCVRLMILTSFQLHFMSSELSSVGGHAPPLEVNMYILRATREIRPTIIV